MVDFFLDALNSPDDNPRGRSKKETELYKIFLEKPATLDEFMSEDRYLGKIMGNATLSPIQRDFVTHFVQVLRPETYLLMAECWGDEFSPTRTVNNLAIAWGKGSGKDFCVQIGFAYIAHILLCLRSPQEYYDVPGNTYIHLLNIAISATQALTVFYTPLRDLLTTTEFFQDKFVGDLPGPRASTMYLKHNIVLVSGHSEASSMEGKNILACCLDEVAGFATEAEASATGRSLTKTAEGLIKMAQSSAQTRFPDTFKVVLISFARRHGDAIMTALREAKEDEKEYGTKSTYYHSHHSTWEVNPRFRKKFKFIQIPQSSQLIPNSQNIISDYKKDPVFARGYYECKPEKSSNPYFKDKEAIKSAFSREVEKEPLELEYFYGVDHTENDRYPSWQVRFNLNDLKPIEGACYAIHADMAKNGDVAGIAMSHVKEYKEIVTTTVDGYANEEMQPIVTVDFATAFTHDMAATDPDGTSIPREIQMRWFRKLVYWLTDKGFNILSVSMDGFQSTDSLQSMEAKGYSTSRVSTDINNAVWQSLRDTMYDGRLNGYRKLNEDNKEIQPRVVAELESLTKLPNGKVDHPADFGKDIIDALACSVVGAITIGGSEELDGSGSNFFTGQSLGDLTNPFEGSSDEFGFNGAVADSSTVGDTTTWW